MCPLPGGTSGAPCQQNCHETSPLRLDAGSRQAGRGDRLVLQRVTRRPRREEGLSQDPAAGQKSVFLATAAAFRGHTWGLPVPRTAVSSTLMGAGAGRPSQSRGHGLGAGRHPGTPPAPLWTVNSCHRIWWPLPPRVPAMIAGSPDLQAPTEPTLPFLWPKGERAGFLECFSPDAAAPAQSAGLKGGERGDLDAGLGGVLRRRPCLARCQQPLTLWMPKKPTALGHGSHPQMSQHQCWQNNWPRGEFSRAPALCRTPNTLGARESDGKRNL